MAATAIDSPGTALIVASDREDRRVLFDTLDTQAFDAIYSAKDIHSARGFVREDPDIHLVLLEFEENPREALSFCSDLRAQIATSTVPIIGILGPRRDAWNAENTPPGLIEWIASPVQPDDAKTRVGIALAARRSRTARSETVAIGSDRYQFVFDGGIDELAIVDPASGHILDVNEVFVQRSGHSLQELISAPIDAFDAVLTSEQRSELNLRLERDDNVYLRGRRRHANGSLYPIDMHVRRAVQDARVVHFYRFREIGELGNYQGALSAIGQLTERSPHEEATDTVLQAIVAWLGLDFVAAVEAPAELTGEAREIAVYHRFEPPQASSDPLRGAAMRRVLAGREVIHASHASSHCADDSFLRESRFEFVIGLPLVGERQTYLGAMLVARREPLEGDKTVVEGLRVAAFVLARELELRRTREQGRAEGLRDPLTGMPNRLLFNDRLNSAIREGSRTSEMFAVMFVDLDRFKNINDSLGHVVGDEVLKGVARRLRGCVRASDTVARYAGDEFTLILRHIVQRDDVVRIADKIVSAMEVPLQLAAGLELSVTASIGVSFYPDDAADAEKLLKHADVAMYAAKALGRNNHQVYVAVPEEAHRQRLALEAKLRVAEKKGELRVFYQPLVDGVSDDIVGMEALIRWQHPELGMIGPGFFIPLAEESGLIVSIGEWVLRTACRDASRWHKLFGLPLRLGVNLSPLQLRQPKFVDLCAMVIKQAEIDPHLLDLEITESISIKSIPNLLETLHNLRSLGCGISIDDFGTGQSSLDYIKRFPADRIKIDQTFVRNIGVDPDDEAIVEATISMAHNLNRKVVAEGVEIEQHLEFLRNQGCDTLQGFLFCRPLPAISFEKLLLERTRLLGQRR